jgi:SAM-dependent methyltransferase
MSVGYDAIRLILAALVTNDRPVPKRILDFPSGSGRVTRHLCAMFPDAHVGACDLYEGHIDFCAKQFGAEPLLSVEDLDDLDVGSDWDLVFCGSLLTHLPEPLFHKAMNFIVRSLSPTGIALVTLEGRHAEWRQDNTWKFMDDDLFEAARQGFHKDGFGYSDYNPDFKATFDKQESYGIALAQPSWTMKALEHREEIRILGYWERAWDQHQDVVVFGRPGVNDGAPRPGGG